MKFLIVCSHGSDCVERCYAPYNLGATLAASDHEVVLFHWMDAADLVKKGVVEKIQAPPPMPPLSKLRDTMKELGVSFRVCCNSADFRMLKKKDLIDYVESCDALTMVDYITEADETIWL